MNLKTVQEKKMIKTYERCKKDSDINNFRNAENAEQYNQCHHRRKHGSKRAGISDIDKKIKKDIK